MKNNQPNAPLSKKVGDKIEDVGHKISNAGAEKIGAFVSRMGDKLEHSSDPKPESDVEASKKNK
ncbi:hypothetical protein CIK05_04405 [Bdellovibrio sp. qaytius]|nr:hypothetical protein CIK05_04405 [Bdellovibrio sp. qaytius]